MKKIFYILTAAVVALGAMACENEGLENVAPETNGEGLTITATVSRVTWSEDTLAPTKWDNDDVITIDDKFKFTTTDGVNFVCNDKDVYSLCDGNKHVATTPLDSKNGLKGVSLKAEDVITVEGTSLTFTPASALLMFTAESAITLEATAGLFSGDATQLEFAAGKHYVAINPIKATLKGAIGKLKDGSYTAVTATEGTFVAGEVYNLGTLKAAAKVWILGDWNTWSAPLYMFEENNYYVAKNVAIGASEGFKFHDGSLYLGGASTKGTWNNFGGSNIKLGEGTYDIYVSKANGAWCAVTAGSSVPALSVKYVYLKPSSEWQQAGAKFHAWCWGGSNSDAWISFEWLMNEGDTNYYYVNVKDYKQCKFIRQDPSQSAGWTHWGETGNQNIGNNTLCTITGWASSVKWSSLIP